MTRLNTTEANAGPGHPSWGKFPDGHASVADDIARLTALVADLTAANAALAADNARLVQRLDEARGVIEFYADPAGWNQPPVRTIEGLVSIHYENQASKIQRDRGKAARAFLAGGDA